MTFLDVQELNRPGSWTPSPGGDWMLYTINDPDWREDRSQTDLYLVSTSEGLPSTRRLTFTDAADEGRPAWAPGGDWFVFASDRDDGAEGSGDQLYMMRIDGGEARRITDAAEGVRDFDFSPDGTWLVFRSGDSGMEQLHALDVSALEYALQSGTTVEAEADALTDEPAGIDNWEFSPDGARVYFNRADRFLDDEKKRLELGFTVDIRNPVTPMSNLHVLDLGSGNAEALTSDPSVSVDNFVVSPDGAWVAFQGGSAERYERNITATGLYRDVFLMEVATGTIERLTDNYEVSEGGLTFSPDSRRLAFSAPDDMTRYTMTENRVYVRAVDDRGAPLRKLGSDFDGRVGADFWSEDGGTIYFTTGVKVTTQLHALDVASGAVRQVTNESAAMRVSRDDDSGTILIDYQDPMTPPTVFSVASLDD
ncbi:MAG: PD40 domain-containing protein, partial [Gemmatimonadetes bacterium]|nr:PD40 domain-containing protein [Gemmatimonadota bacterium]